MALGENVWNAIPITKISYDYGPPQQQVVYNQVVQHHAYPNCGCPQCYDAQRREHELYRAMREMQAEFWRMTHLNMGPQLKQLSAPKGGDMNIVDKIKNVSLGEGDKLLRKYGLVDQTGSLTDAGEKVVLQHLFGTAKDDIVALVKKVAAEEKAKKAAN